MDIAVEKIAIPGGVNSLITVTNGAGASVTLSSHGAGIARAVVPDHNNLLNNVVHSYLPNDDGLIWHHEIINDDEVLFAYVSPHKGGLRRKISYRWTDDNVLEVYFHDDPHHWERTDILGQTYFNLDIAPESLPDEYLWVNSLEHPDFHRSTQLSRRLIGTKPFAHSWQLLDWQEGVMNDGALLASHLTGRQLSIHTSFPTLRVTIPSTRDGIALSTTPLHTTNPLPSPQTTFLHFSLLH